MSAVPSSSSRDSFEGTFISCIVVSWDCGVVAAEDDVVTIPSSSRERRGKDTGSVERFREREQQKS